MITSTVLLMTTCVAQNFATSSHGEAASKQDAWRSFRRPPRIRVRLADHHEAQHYHGVHGNKGGPIAAARRHKCGGHHSCGEPAGEPPALPLGDAGGRWTPSPRSGSPERHKVLGGWEGQKDSREGLEHRLNERARNTKRAEARGDGRTLDDRERPRGTACCAASNWAPHKRTTVNTGHPTGGSETTTDRPIDRPTEPPGSGTIGPKSGAGDRLDMRSGTGPQGSDFIHNITGSDSVFWEETDLGDPRRSGRVGQDRPWTLTCKHHRSPSSRPNHDPPHHRHPPLRTCAHVLEAPAPSRRPWRPGRGRGRRPARGRPRARAASRSPGGTRRRRRRAASGAPAAGDAALGRRHFIAALPASPSSPA